VPANKIVFAGDSAGGNLSLVLVQVLLTLQRVYPNRAIRFHGKDVPVSLPASIATISPWMDLTRSMPSVWENAKFDYIRPPIQMSASVFTPLPFPADSCWPASPPRLDLYANANALANTLVSPLSGPNNLWKDAPPIFITMGEETMEDEGLYFARKAHGAGATVVLERFEGMPHCFAFLIPNISTAKRCFQGLTDFCLDAVHGRVKKTGGAVFINRTQTKSESRSLDEIGILSEEEVQRKLTAAKDLQVEVEKELLKKWKQTVDRAKL
jgi:acetyl esterase/lipase